MTLSDIVDQELIKKNEVLTRKILIAEDDPINVFLLTRILEPAKFHLTIAENGQIALDKFKEQIFDAILMDIYMPLMNGLELSKKIRLISDTIPIIAVTAADLRGKNLKIEYGIDYLINKPIDIFKLKSLLNDLICL